ncbi:hypothetical protein CEXT_682751 [Caerostris extrusa]|uniref:Uncharacterized protein n=1 Tax=Caerostris extrusa TaxID=172846 RepID=A0AAV4R077_CAEEX|nr:hypothetical protein CEXT_682751 [Caerostris extrusa]
MVSRSFAAAWISWCVWLFRVYRFAGEILQHCFSVHGRCEVDFSSTTCVVLYGLVFCVLRGIYFVLVYQFPEGYIFLELDLRGLRCSYRCCFVLFDNFFVFYLLICKF